ncbi:MAG: site-specific integrase [Curvibacter sp.]|nr:MAG: site-specific integrase [Curvibacter sp.]
MKDNARKLHSPAASEFEIVSHVLGDAAVGRDASNIPLVVWPDGRWCFEVNAYMLRLLDRGLSRFNRGGTLSTYATYLSHLIRFCANNSLEFRELTDSSFTLFIRGINGERSRDSIAAKRRESSSVIDIAKICLDFLEFVGKLNGITLIGPTAAIRAERVKSARPGFGGSQIYVESWHHHSLPTPSPERERLPVSSASIMRMRDQIPKCSSTEFQVRRRQVMLRALDITGGRRSEISNLTVESVINASQMVPPRLELLTVKGRGKHKNKARLIPITRHDANLLLQFVRVNRQTIIKRTCGARHDHGFVFISEKTGNALRPNTITQEISTISRAAKLDVRVSPHLFRHRFITNVFRALIEEYKAQNADEFRSKLMSDQDIKTKLAEWTGHSSIESLDRYIHLAFAEINGLNKSIEIVAAKRAIRTFEMALTQIDLDIQNEQELVKRTEELRNLVEEVLQDLGGDQQSS